MMIIKHCCLNSCLAKKSYLEKYGYHFSKKLYEFAISLMSHSGKLNLTEDLITTILDKYDIEPSYDAYFVVNMGYHDFYKSSLEDEEHLALFVKDYLDDEDGYEGIAFCRWLTDMKYKEITIDWDNVL